MKFKDLFAKLFEKSESAPKAQTPKNLFIFISTTGQFIGPFTSLSQLDDYIRKHPVCGTAYHISLTKDGAPNLFKRLFRIAHV
jgi:hypothetical protein